MPSCLQEALESLKQNPCVEVCSVNTHAALLSCVESQGKVLVLMTVTSDEELASAFSFLMSQEKKIKTGCLRVIVFNSAATLNASEQLRTAGCAEIFEGAISTSQLNYKIHENMAEIAPYFSENPLEELEIFEVAGAQSPQALQEFSEEKTTPFSVDESVFISFELQVRIKSSATTETALWTPVAFMEGDPQELILSAPVNSVVCDDELIVEFVAKTDKEILNFEIRGIVVSAEIYENEPEMLVGIRPTRGDPSKIQALMDVFAARQSEIQDFITQARGY